ncbi:leucine-rich repeat-containing protein 28-like [Stylophora pistillata]|uniref:leucine-rich repeat-containing protein 28-like n=1 Tax=Stylophora pistillata TaxID=50429 RepID=UPI000C039540|nr:leucine-rich repeat-containing protein 28-like [Stylophora pistillata]
MCESVNEEILEAQSKGHTNLYLNYRKLSELPEELLTLSRVKKLYLKRNVLTKLPADIWKLENLVELYLYSNYLHHLPDEIGKLQLLEKLNVGFNYLNILTPAIGQLKSLTSLQLANNQLTYLPKELGNLTNLRDLNVMNNKLEWLPWQLCNCSSLKILSFDGNAVQKIPHQLMTHQGLAELYASGNKLCTLPQDLNKLSSLEFLILDHNTELQLLPATLLKMKDLKMIGLSGCGSKEPARLPRTDSKELEEVFNVRNILQGSSGRIPPLLELCFRAVLCLVQSLNDEKLYSLELPSHVTKLLAAPTGHCFVCDSCYFTAVFFREENADTALRITKPSAEIFQGLGDTTSSFVFCCCSRNCLDEVGRLCDIPV